MTFGVAKNIFTRFTTNSISSQLIPFDKSHYRNSVLFRIRSSIDLGGIANRNRNKFLANFQNSRNIFRYNIILVRRTLLVKVKRIFTRREKSLFRRKRHLNIVKFITLQKAVRNPFEFCRSCIAIRNGIGQSGNHESLRQNGQRTVSNFKFHIRVVDRSIFEILGRKPHRISVGIYTRHSIFSCKLDELQRIRRAIRQNIVASNAMFLAIVLYSIDMTFYSNNNLAIVRCNREHAAFGNSNNIIRIGLCIYGCSNCVFTSILALFANKRYTRQSILHTIKGSKAINGVS